MARESSGGLAQQSYEPRLKFDQHHIAAVKAVSWCPWHRNILATGGGTADRTIRIWNSSTGSNLKCIDTGSQVCSIQWGENHKELYSSHGFSDNQVVVWHYNDMKKIHEFRGHTARVLHMAKGPSGDTLCTASADETLRFWNISDHPHRSVSTPSSSCHTPKRGRAGSIILSGTPGSMSIR